MTSEKWKAASLVLVVALAAISALPAQAQLPGGTPPGIQLTATPNQSGPVAATGVNFYMGTVAGGPFVLINTAPAPVSAPTLFVPAASFVSGTTYFFAATDVSSAGVESVSSGVVSAVATFPPAPAAPALAVQVRGGSVSGSAAIKK